MKPVPTTDSQGRLLCADASITLATTTRVDSYRVGSQPILGITVTNNSPEPCVRDVSGTLQVFTVYNAQHQRIWSTADCFPGQGTESWMFGPGQSRRFDIKWAGTTSQPGCVAHRVAVPTGSYTAVAQLGTLKAAPATFAITQ